MFLKRLKVVWLLMRIKVYSIKELDGWISILLLSESDSRLEKETIEKIKKLAQSKEDWLFIYYNLQKSGKPELFSLTDVNKK